MGRLAGFCVFFFSVAPWVVPNHHEPWLSFHSEMVAATGLCFALASVSAYGSRRVWVPKEAFFFVLLVPLLFVQYAAGLIYFFSDVWVAAGYLAIFALAVFSGAAMQNSVGRESALMLICVAILVAAWLSLLISLYQWSGRQWAGIWVASYPPAGRWYANIKQPNHFATLLAFAWAAAFYIWVTGRMHGRWFCVVTFPLLFAGGMTQSRLVLLYGLLTTVLHILPLRKRGAGISLSAIYLSWMIVLGAWLGAPALLSLSGDAAAATLSERSSVGVRAVIWSLAWRAILEAPWVGYGALQTPVALAAVADVSIWGRPVLYAHNLLLDIFLWFGVPVGLLLFGSVVRWVWLKASSLATMEDRLALLLLSYFFAHAMLEFPFAYLYILIPVGLVVGLTSRSEVFVVSRRVGVAVSLGALVLLISFASKYFRHEEEVRGARFKVNDPIMSMIPWGKAFVERRDLLVAYVDSLNAAPFASVDSRRAAEMVMVARRWPEPETLRQAIYALIAQGSFRDARKELDRYGHLFGVVSRARLCHRLRTLGGQVPVVHRFWMEGGEASCFSDGQVLGLSVGRLGQDKMRSPDAVF